MIHRFCVIFANADAIETVSKAWVPEKYEGKELLFKSDAIINAYIGGLESSWNPSKTIRMSIIAGKGWNDTQLIILPALLNSNKGRMVIKPLCKKDINEISNHRVNYDD